MLSQCPGCLLWGEPLHHTPDECMVPTCPVLCMLGFVWVRDAAGVWQADLSLGSIHGP